MRSLEPHQRGCYRWLRPGAAFQAKLGARQRRGEEVCHRQPASTQPRTQTPAESRGPVPPSSGDRKRRRKRPRLAQSETSPEGAGSRSPEPRPGAQPRGAPPATARLHAAVPGLRAARGGRSLPLPFLLLLLPSGSSTVRARRRDLVRRLSCSMALSILGAAADSRPPPAAAATPPPSAHGGGAGAGAQAARAAAGPRPSAHAGQAGARREMAARGGPRG